MLQRVQTLWMILTVSMVSVVLFSPAVSFSMGGVDFRLMSYGITGGSDGGSSGGVRKKTEETDGSASGLALVIESRTSYRSSGTSPA